MFNKILIAVDESSSSQYIFDQALTIAQKFTSELILLHITSPITDIYRIGVPMYPGVDPTMDMSYGAFPIDNEIYAKMQKETNTQSLHFLDLLAQQAGNIPVKSLIESGDPGESICEVAKDNQADLIIVGTHGLTGVKELLLGSVSNYVVHHAPCAVLTLPIKEN